MSDPFNTVPPTPPAPKKDNKTQILAASFFALAAAILVLILVLPSSNSDSGNESGAVNQASPAVTDAPINKYDAYYEHVLNESGRANSMSKADVIQLGDLVCQAFDEGNSVAAVVSVMSRASSDSSDIELAAAAMWGATEYLCSEYKPMVQAYLNN